MGQQLQQCRGLIKEYGGPLVGAGMPSERALKGPGGAEILLEGWGNPLIELVGHARKLESSTGELSGGSYERDP